MRPPLTYFGGKQNLSKKIVSLIPEHHLYSEPFFGGGAVFFAKEPSPVEVINDISGEAINFYRVVKTQYRQLENEIKTTLSSRELHRKACIIYQYPDLFTEVTRAWAIWVLSTQCYGSILGSSWNYDRKTNQSVKKLNSKRASSVEEYAKRLENTQIECKDALYVIRSRDSKESFFYCDPPYIGAHQGHYRGYEEIDFEKLLVQLSEIKGKFLLSSYPSEVLAKYTKQNKWYQQKIEMKLCLGVNPKVKNKVKTEVLTANYPI
ncbi:MAG TPA: DNA adenine methylase [Bacteroidia bacterium]|jgi:DNA adenine methylase|nr:DNA adenine methylase [Bacteroidia bacterium]